MLKKVLRGTLVSIIGLGLFMSNPVKMCEGNDNSSDINIAVEEKEVVSLRTISISKEELVEEKNSKVTNVTNSKSQKKYLSLEEVKALTNPNMDLSKPSGLSRRDFVRLIRNMKYDYTGVFRRNARYIWKLAHQYQFNEVFFVAIIANESLWGASELAIAHNNYTSQMKLEKEEIIEEEETKIIYKLKMISYLSERECFLETAKNLRTNYFEEDGKYYNGTNIYEINECYCEPGTHENGTPYKYMWAENTYRCMEMILGK